MLGARLAAAEGDKCTLEAELSAARSRAAAADQHAAVLLVCSFVSLSLFHSLSHPPLPPNSFSLYLSLSRARALSLCMHA